MMRMHFSRRKLLLLETIGFSLIVLVVTSLSNSYEFDDKTLLGAETKYNENDQQEVGLSKCFPTEQIRSKQQMNSEQGNCESDHEIQSMAAAARLVSLEFEVFGKVQGVFFRKYTQNTGKSLGVRGWCENTSRGTVVGALEGPGDKIKTMKDWLSKTGSPKSRIDRAEFRNEKLINEYTFSGFDIIRKK